MYGNEKRSQLIAFSAVFVALIAVGGWISIPIMMIPFTMQNFFMLLAAAVMKRYAVIPVGLYVLLGTLGLPIFHNGTAGIGVLLGPTGGFLIGFFLMSGVAGLLFEKKSVRFDILALVLFGVGSYLFGAGWFMISTGASVVAAFVACVLPFVIGDVIKFAVIEVIVLRLRKSGIDLL
ncbi:biotin transporter BioY [Methanorbis furvi]|uniref:Biotin transporter BioY n=1 Tax=Methanorbis furvi TaxID=3028299 RepID=A0AAE4MBC8_9EURY|nr:Biotin transporter BioY [Methanocorpusculaceae archaeon Ag1]